MTHSHFKNPAGLDDPEQVTTARDLALASRELLGHPQLSRIVSIKEIIISDVDFRIFHTLSNVNKLLGEVQSIGGLKTGYTDQAGENLVSFYKNNGHQFLIVILKSQDRFADTLTVVKWLTENITYTNVLLR
jgi:D-alanyl-D-alanine carboxypeptidase (penicillin-binding protein 5/6)